MSKASLKTTSEWNNINWTKVQRKLFKLQKRIFQAVKLGQKAKARNLQKILIKSYYAKLLAVRRVTQDNQGKKTAGVDGKKIIHNYQRITLAISLDPLNYKSKALRRVWIPKPSNDEKRPLGIPTIQDRAMQALIKMALEPYWEAQFEGTSYGFRPGRSAHDAIEKIFSCINQRTKYVLDADIAKCFDRINHKYLLSKLECPSSLKTLIKQWLKAGVMDNGIFEKTIAGTPQGGVISPLLANIAMDGMIREVTENFPQSKTINGKRDKTYRPQIIRYADDFVVLHKEFAVIEHCKKLISEWLEKVGLELKPEKTRICHTLNEINIEGETIKPGFDFLGFNIRSYPKGVHKCGTINNQGARIGFKTLIKPSKKAVKAHLEAMKTVIKNHKTAPQEALISHLNPIIVGWCNYYKTVVSKEIYHETDHGLWVMLRAWTVSRTGKGNYRKLKKYFSKGVHGNWTFQSNGNILKTHSETKIKRHIAVKSDSSPYDGNWTYWSTRQGTYPETPSRVSNLMKTQKGKCNLCHLSFLPDDIVEIDHIIPSSIGGKDEYKNLQLLHRHCHDKKTTKDGSLNLNRPMTKEG
jgi:RNA-directed DNA polymerase